MKKNQQALLRELKMAIMKIDSIVKGDLSLKASLLKTLFRMKNEIEEKIYLSDSTLMRVEFSNPMKAINCNTAKDTYVESIKMLEIENVKQYFPKLIKHQPGKSLVCIAPNRYLYVGLNNTDKQRNIERIAKRLGRVVKVTLYHSTPYYLPMPSSSFSQLETM